jgi:ferritin-like metal-binding protein YciE
MELATLNDLFLEELQDLYSAETQMTKALPKMAEAASSAELKRAFEEHLKQTEGHIARLERIFEKLGEKPGGKTCKGMAGLIKEGEELISEKPEPDVLDAGLIAAAQRVEHYEIAGYGTVRTYANEIGQKEFARLLQETLDEEGATDKRLTRIAEGGINQKAMAA